MNAKTLERLRKTRYGKEKNRIAQDLLGILAENGLDISAVAKAAGLSPQTVRNLANNDTMFVQFLTFWKISGVVGYALGPAKRKGGKAIDVAVDTGRRKRKKKQRGGRKKA
jgi:transcriptional regulator with XRE-family HTH domain